MLGVPEILIVGSGVCGPAAAIALYRAGVAVRVIERSDASQRAANPGSYLTLASNGLDALAAIGVREQLLSDTCATIPRTTTLGRCLRGRPFPMQTISFVNGAGRNLGQIAAGIPAASRDDDVGSGGSGGGGGGGEEKSSNEVHGDADGGLEGDRGAITDRYCSHTMRRSFLEQRLREIAEVDCGIVFTDGVALVSAEPLGGDRGVRATLSDGTTATFRAVVGCDGINSTVRSIIDPHAPQPRYVGLANFGGYTEGVSEGQPGHWHMHFGYKAFFGFARDNDGGTAWFANLPQNEPVPRETRNSRSMDDWKNELCAAFADDAGPAVKLIRAGQLDLAADNTRDLPHVPIWSRDGLIVIGDAAHAPSPSSGQGASMAIEDAVVLAQCIRDNPDSMALAFRTFEAARRERVEKIVAEGARSSNNKIAGPVGRFFRDLMLPLVFRFLVTPASNQWLYGHHIDWDMKMTAGNGK